MGLSGAAFQKGELGSKSFEKGWGMVKKSAKKAPGFEARLAELEEIVKKLDAEDVPLEEAISFYEQGVLLSGELNKTLDEVQRRIEILTQNAKGELVTESFDEEEQLDD